jgi:hypothetical protein
MAIMGNNMRMLSSNDEPYTADNWQIWIEFRVAMAGIPVALFKNDLRELADDIAGSYSDPAHPDPDEQYRGMLLLKLLRGREAHCAKSG